MLASGSASEAVYEALVAFFDRQNAADVGNFEKPRDAVTGVLTEVLLQIPVFRLQDELFPMICFVDPHFARLILVLAACWAAKTRYLTYMEDVGSPNKETDAKKLPYDLLVHDRDDFLLASPFGFGRPAARGHENRGPSSDLVQFGIT
jgi:hypothetical protein